MTDRGEEDAWHHRCITVLVNAVARLQEGLERHRREPADEQLRDGLI